MRARKADETRLTVGDKHSLRALQMLASTPWVTSGNESLGRDYGSCTGHIVGPCRRAADISSVGVEQVDGVTADLSITTDGTLGTLSTSDIVNGNGLSPFPGSTITHNVTKFFYRAICGKRQSGRERHFYYVQRR